MRDIMRTLRDWAAHGTGFTTATVVRTWNSAPRPIGATMAVSQDGEAVGSVSGGCVEGAVYEVSREVLATGVPQLVRYGVADSDALAIGMTCGGTIELFVTRADQEDRDLLCLLADRIAAGEPVALATALSAGTQDTGEREGAGRRMLITPDAGTGSLGDPVLDAAVRRAARDRLAVEATGIAEFAPGADRAPTSDDPAAQPLTSVFIDTYAPPPAMLVFGAIDFAGAMTRIGKFLGYRVTVCDARPVFATSARFPDADEVVVAWPHRFLETATVDARTVMCVLTHDNKFDVPLLLRALRSPAAYVGAMGSRNAHLDRLDRLREAGLSEAELARLHSPIGLDLGGRTPEETAISIAAEIIASARSGSGRPLAELDATIHPQLRTPGPSHPPG